MLLCWNVFCTWHLTNRLNWTKLTLYLGYSLAGVGESEYRRATDATCTLQYALPKTWGKQAIVKEWDFSFIYSWTNLFYVGARVWAREWKAEFSRSDSYRHGAEEADWEFIFWSQHSCASQPCRDTAWHSYPTRSEQSVCAQVKVMLRESFW